MAYAGPSRYTYIQNYKLKALSDSNFLIVLHERGEYPSEQNDLSWQNKTVPYKRHKTDKSFNQWLFNMFYNKKK